MTPLFKKLNLKDHKEVYVVACPEEVTSEIEDIAAYVRVYNTIEDADKIGFILVFVKSADEVAGIVPHLMPKLEGDAVVWFAYPKGTSKKYKVTINRDHGWEAVRAQGWDTVRQVAIDADWSALRFRKEGYIKR